MKDLFGGNSRANETSLLVYCDERVIKRESHPNNESWIYIALLLVPESKRQGAINALNKHRETKTVEYFGELKFAKLRKRDGNSRITRLAKLWIQEIINNFDKCFYLKVLGIKADNLLFQLFGEGSDATGKYATIYNRFFRTAFLSAVNTYWPRADYQKVVISELFHDKQGLLEAHQFFPWHLPYKASDDRIVFNSDHFVFIDSNHNKEPQYKDDSHLIQLADILVGSISHCLDLVTGDNKGKNEVAKVILPFLKEILNCGHFRRCDVSFYPLRKLTPQEFGDDVCRSKSQFFRKRSILLEEHLFGKQLSFSFKGV